MVDYLLSHAMDAPMFGRETGDDLMWPGLTLTPTLTLIDLLRVHGEFESRFASGSFEDRDGKRGVISLAMLHVGHLTFDQACKTGDKLW